MSNVSTIDHSSKIFIQGINRLIKTIIKESIMDFIKWFIHNFGLFFGVVFIVYFYLIVYRFICLYEILRHVPKNIHTITHKKNCMALKFMAPYFKRLECLKHKNQSTVDPVIDAMWSEMDSQISVHFIAINGYIYSLILIGFAGTIFGSIGAFTQMFQGLAQNIEPVTVFMKAWNSGLSTALYTSLGAASIGGFMITLLYSKFLLTRARCLESILGLAISETLDV